MEKDAEKKDRAGKRKFSENEMLNFTSFTLSMMETQIKLLSNIAFKLGIDRRELDKMRVDASSEKEFFEKLICEND